VSPGGWCDIPSLWKALDAGHNMLEVWACCGCLRIWPSFRSSCFFLFSCLQGRPHILYLLNQVAWHFILDRQPRLFGWQKLLDWMIYPYWWMVINQNISGFHIPKVWGFPWHWWPQRLASGNLTQLWKITMLNSIASIASTVSHWPGGLCKCDRQGDGGSHREASRWSQNRPGCGCYEGAL
jgi:hypothetical protein